MKNKKYKVLIVDDIEVNLQVLGGMLGKKNIAILFASNGKQAIKIARKKLPDLILLDINMPEMNGYAVCEILKNDEQTKEIPIIFLSALNEKNDIVKGFESGAVDYITKPFNNAELLARLFTHLELKTARDIINKQNKELKRINATKDKFFSIIAHDLKNPFNALMGFSSLLLKNHLTYDAKMREKFIESINSCAEISYKLLENLLTWSRSQSGSIKYNPIKLDMKTQLYETIYVLAAQASKKNISILNEIKEKELIYADEKMFGTIIRNLISNAIKFTNKNGKIEISAEKQDGNWIKIAVKDNGKGISQDVVKNLFKIDKNISTLGTDNETGTGLGLILCKEFVEKHNGKIWVESELGNGASFFFTIPCHKK